MNLVKRVIERIMDGNAPTRDGGLPFDSVVIERRGDEMRVEWIHERSAIASQVVLIQDGQCLHLPTPGANLKVTIL